MQPATVIKQRIVVSRATRAICASRHARGQCYHLSVS